MSQISDEDCEKWRRSPKVNPKTGKKLYEKAGPYKKYLERCGSPVVSSPSRSSPQRGSPSRSSTLETDCEKWQCNKLVNPKTGRSIQPTGKVYKDLQKKCASSPKKVSPPSLSRSPKGKSPIKTSQKKELSVNSSFTPEECMKWMADTTKNTRTNRKIIEG